MSAQNLPVMVEAEGGREIVSMDPKVQSDADSSVDLEWNANGGNSGIHKDMMEVAEDDLKLILTFVTDLENLEIQEVVFEEISEEMAMEEAEDNKESIGKSSKIVAGQKKIKFRKGPNADLGPMLYSSRRGERKVENGLLTNKRPEKNLILRKKVDKRHETPEEDMCPDVSDINNDDENCVDVIGLDDAVKAVDAVTLISTLEENVQFVAGPNGTDLEFGGDSEDVK